MNAILKSKFDTGEDCEVVVEMILHVDPAAAVSESAAYQTVRTKLLDLGWTLLRFNTAVFELRASGRLFLSRSRKTLSFKPIRHELPKKQRCVYCRRVRKNLTKDHVIPRSKGGSRNSSNVVLACSACNQAKGDRTPAEWANDILEYGKRV